MFTAAILRRRYTHTHTNTHMLPQSHLLNAYSFLLPLLKTLFKCDASITLRNMLLMFVLWSTCVHVCIYVCVCVLAVRAGLYQRAWVLAWQALCALITRIFDFNPPECAGKQSRSNKGLHCCCGCCCCYCCLLVYSLSQYARPHTHTQTHNNT